MRIKGEAERAPQGTVVPTGLGKPPRPAQKAVGPVGLAVFVMVAVFLAAGPAAGKSYGIGSYDIQLELTKDGRYIITERITYVFEEGVFTKANRHVPATGFKQLRFVSLEGVDVPVTSVNYTDGRGLRVDWTYRETSDEATFLLTYEASGGLGLRDGRNVIDWNPIGSDWSVPIRDVTVTVRLPQEASDGVVALPAEDVQPGGPANEVTFHRAHMPPNTYYHVVVSFPQIIAVVEDPPMPYGLWVWSGLALGLLLLASEWVFYTRDRLSPAPGGPPLEDVSLLEMGGLLARDEMQRRRGVAATVFAWAQAGHLRLVVAPRRWAADDVRVEILDPPALNGAEQLLFDRLRERRTLRRFAQDTGAFRRIGAKTRKQLIAKGLVSKELIRRQNGIVLFSLLLMVATVVGFVLFGIHERPELLSFSVASLLWAVGKLVRGAMTTTLTPAGRHVKQLLEQQLDERLQRVDDLMRYEMPRAWDALFADLPMLTLHPKVNHRRLRLWQREFRRLERVNAPEWLGLDGAETGGAMEAMTVAQTVNYAFLTVMMTGTTTGAGGMAGGVGAAGSGAGGGGGGAG